MHWMPSCGYVERVLCWRSSIWPHPDKRLRALYLLALWKCCVWGHPVDLGMGLGALHWMPSWWPLERLCAEGHPAGLIVEQRMELSIGDLPVGLVLNGSETYGSGHFLNSAYNGTRKMAWEFTLSAASHWPLKRALCWRLLCQPDCSLWMGEFVVCFLSGWPSPFNLDGHQFHGPWIPH